ncbi:MAG: hypothetical protein HN396_16075 [Gemmatimonadales bacterium]|nr:hypothetical protein [Gemmatimonadales bacterium]
MATSDRLLERLNNPDLSARSAENRIRGLGARPQPGGGLDPLAARLALGDPTSGQRSPVDIGYTMPRVSAETPSPFIDIPGRDGARIIRPQRRKSGFIGLGAIGRNVFGDVEEFVTGLSTLGALAANRVVTSVAHPGTIPDLPGRLVDFGKLAVGAFVTDLREYRDDFWGKAQRDPLFTLLDLGGVVSFSAGKGAALAARVGGEASVVAKTLRHVDNFSNIGKITKRGFAKGQDKLSDAAIAARGRAVARGELRPELPKGALDSTRFEDIIMSFDHIVGREGLGRVFRNLIVDPSNSFSRKLKLGSYKESFRAFGKLSLEEKGRFLDFMEGTFLFDGDAMKAITSGVSEEFVDAVRIWRDNVTTPWEKLISETMHIMTREQLARTSWLPMMVKEAEPKTMAAAATRDIVRLSAREVAELGEGPTPRFQIVDNKTVMLDNATGIRRNIKDTISRHGEASLHNITNKTEQLQEVHARLQRNAMEDGVFIFDTAFEGSGRKVRVRIGETADNLPDIKEMKPADISRVDRITDKQRLIFMEKMGMTADNVLDPVTFLDTMNNRARFVRDVEMARTQREGIQSQLSAAEQAERAGLRKQLADVESTKEGQALVAGEQEAARLRGVRGAQAEELARVEGRAQEATTLADIQSTGAGFPGVDDFAGGAADDVADLTARSAQLRRDLSKLDADIDAAPQSAIDLIAPEAKFVDPTHFSVVMAQELKQRRVFSNMRRIISGREAQRHLEVLGPEISAGDIGPSGTVRKTQILSDRSGRGIFGEGRIGRRTIRDPKTGEIRTVGLDEGELTRKALDLEGAAMWIMRERAHFVRSVDMARAVTKEFGYQLVPSKVRTRDGVKTTTPAKIVSEKTGNAVPLRTQNGDMLSQFDTTNDLLDQLLQEGIQHNGRRFEAVLYLQEFYEITKGMEHSISEQFGTAINKGLNVDEALLDAVTQVTKDPLTREALAKAARRGSKIHVIPREVGEMIQQLGGDQGKRNPKSYTGLGKAVFDDVADMYRIAWLHTPRFIVNTLATNMAMGVVAGIGPRDIIAAMSKKNKVILEDIVELQASQVPVEAGRVGMATRATANPISNVMNVFRQEGVIAGLVHTATGQPIADAVQRLDNLYRRAAFIKQTRTRGTKATLTENVDVFKRMLDDADDEKLAQVFSGVENKQLLRDWTHMRQTLIDGELMDDMTTRLHLAVAEPQAFMDGVNFVNHWFFNYFALSDFERNYVRRALPFYNWMKNIHKLSAQLPTEHPGRTMLVAHLGAATADVTDQEELPNFLKGTVEASFQDLQRLRGGGMNPFETLIFQEPTVGGMVARAVQSANPVIQFLMMAGTASKVFPVGGEFTDANLVRTYNRFMRVNPVTHEIEGEEDAAFPSPPQYFMSLIPQLKAAEGAARALATGAGALFPNRREFQRKIDVLIGDPPAPRRTRGGALVYPNSPYKSLLQFFGLSTTPMQSPDQERLNLLVRRNALLIYDRIQRREEVRKSKEGILPGLISRATTP